MSGGSIALHAQQMCAVTAARRPHHFAQSVQTFESKPYEINELLPPFETEAKMRVSQNDQRFGLGHTLQHG
jgi:hypothetical protein